MACLLVLGSRRSSHSAIIGRSRSHFQEHASLEAVHGYGLMRETSCRALTQRTVELIDQSRLLENYSAEAVEIVAVLRVALFGQSFLPHCPWKAFVLTRFLSLSRKLLLPVTPSDQSFRLIFTKRPSTSTPTTGRNRSTPSDSRSSNMTPTSPSCATSLLRCENFSTPDSRTFFHADLVCKSQRRAQHPVRMESRPSPSCAPPPTPAFIVLYWTTPLSSRRLSHRHDRCSARHFASLALRSVSSTKLTGRTKT